MNKEQYNMYLFDICRLFKLPPKSDDILFSILDLLDEDNKVHLTKTVKATIAEKTKKKINTIDKYITTLIYEGLFSRDERGIYIAISKVFNSWKNRKMSNDSMILTITYNKKKRRMRLNESETGSTEE